MFLPILHQIRHTDNFAAPKETEKGVNMNRNKTKELFEKVTIGGIALKNRFVRSAVWMKMADQEGNITPELMNLYVELAQGGVGLIITGYTYIDKNDQPNPLMSAIYEDRFIPQWKKVTDRVHEYGARIALQIVYGGSQTGLPDSRNRVVLAPSAVTNRVHGIEPKEMTREEIRHVVKCFGDAAYRAKQSGFDAVQIHGAHGYLLSMFLNPYYNRRTDEYGGPDIHNRARIIYEVFTEMRNRVGNDFPIMIKLNFDDFAAPGEGLTLDDSIEMFKKLDEMGIDLIEPSATNESLGNGQMVSRTKIRKAEEQSYYFDAADKIARMVKAPVILMGGNRSVERMDQILQNSPIELFSLGRPLLSEPDLINKWAADKHYEPRCVSCNKCWTFTPNSCVFLQKREQRSVSGAK